MIPFFFHNQRIRSLTDGLGMGLGVGRSPPPGKIPATAFAGANSDKALASSGIDPIGNQKAGIRRERHLHTHQLQRRHFGKEKKKSSHCNSSN